MNLTMVMCARCVHWYVTYVIWAGVAGGGAGRRWLWALGTGSDLGHSGRWSFYLPRAATLLLKRCMNRQIKPTIAVALGSQSLLRGARVEASADALLGAWFRRWPREEAVCGCVLALEIPSLQSRTSGVRVSYFLG